ncbi:MAG: NAD-dependent protein deacylase Cob2 [Anaerolineae bacterium]
MSDPNPNSPAGDALEQAAALLNSARRAVALTGAGISTPSGIPDFRSPDSGLWAHCDPVETASLYSFRHSPKRFYDWIRPLAAQILSASPNAAHYALARLEELGVIQTLITQNIDILHTRAGSLNVLEVHGHIREATCVECFRVYPIEFFIEQFLGNGEMPRCPHDRGLLKPNVVLFGEQLPVKVLRAAQQAARECDVMLVAGSSLEVAPVSEMPLIALAHGAKLIIVDYGSTYLDQEAAFRFYEDVADVLPRLTRIIMRQRGLVDDRTQNPADRG